VAIKALMAVTGLIMIGYLLAHMYGNLKVFAGAEAFNGYAHHLRTIGEPILPHTGLLWIIRVVLLASVVAHALSAFALWKRSNKGRGGRRRYRSMKSRGGVQRTYSSFTLRWGGIIILLFVVYHLLHLTFNVVHPGGAADDPYSRVVNGFQVWWDVALYTIAMLAVGFHLRHGTWSALTTLGLNTSGVARRRLNLLAYAVAGVVTVGFLLPPYAVLFGVVH
jgi:succinate dehydrogenase / fumarate reductase cytochrome b subunit